MTIDDVDVQDFISKVGCYVVSDGVNIVVAYQCDSKESHLIDPYGDSIFVSYAQGNMGVLLNLIDPENAPEYIIYVREGRSKVRQYKFERLISKIIN